MNNLFCSLFLVSVNTNLYKNAVYRIPICETDYLFLVAKSTLLTIENSKFKTISGGNLTPKFQAEASDALYETLRYPLRIFQDEF